MAVGTLERTVKPVDSPPQWTRTAQIRTRFPNPTVLSAGNRNGYCVGGAFVGYYGKGYVPGYGGRSHAGFPHSIEIANVLRAINPHLDVVRADMYASTIVSRNDQSQFDEAWQALEQALAY